MRHWRRNVVLSLVLTAGSVAFAAGEVRADPGHGQLGALSGQWWQWALSIPAVSNPLADPNDSKLCGVGQSGPVWFLGGTLDGSPARRSCTVPPGVALLIPAVNAECSTAESPELTTPRALRACAVDLIDHVTEATARVDGRRLPLKRVVSPLVHVTLPPGNVLGLVDPLPNPSPSVGDGYYALVPPLSPGRHTIKVAATAVFPDFTFAQDVEYTVEVLAR